MIETKSSGVEWIGTIPATWSINRVKFLATYNDEVLKESEKPETEIEYVEIGSVSLERGIERTERMLFKDSPSRARRVAQKGDIIVSTVRTYLKAIATVERDGLIVSTGFCVLRPNAKINPKFLEYYCKSSAFTDCVSANSVGISYPAISASTLVGLFVITPPVEEQKTIAAELDGKCRIIDEIIQNDTKQIKRLKAYKLSLITNAVTKGLASSVPMKDSGVDWIGQIPSGWKTIRIKHLLRERNERSINGEEEPLSMSQKVGLVPTRFLDMVPNMASSFVGAKIAHVDDLVFNKLKAHLGVFSVSQYNGLVSPDYAVYYSTGLADLKYLEYLFKTPQCIAEFRKRSTGIAAGLTRLYTDDLFAIECPFPDLDEQKRIVAYLNRKCECIDRLISLKQAKIEKLSEYKKSLVYEYVTGKKEVC